jgi:hypothetical protein
MKQTAAHGRCGYPIFQKQICMGLINFYLTNIKYYLYFFSLTLKIHESLNFLVPQSEARPFIFHARCETFFDSLDFLLIIFYAFGFFFSMADAFSAFLLTLILFLSSRPWKS